MPNLNLKDIRHHTQLWSVRCLLFVCIFLVSLLSLPGSTQLVYAQLTPADLGSMLNNTVNYNPADGEECSVEQPAIGGGATSNTASGDSEGFPLRLPLITDANKLAGAIDAYIQQKKPGSPLNGKGKYFVQGGMRAGINPILVLAHAQKETGFGEDGSGIKSGSHNSFGRSASDSQPGVVTSRKWYKWESWEKSLYADAFPASGKTDQPDDIFQYIARRYVDNLDRGLTSYMEGGNGLPGYGPSSDGNDVPGYIKHINSVGEAISALAGGAVDLGKLGATTNSGTATTQVTGTQTVVALDPGHGAVVPEYTDPVTGLGDRETDNSPEREDAQVVANIVKTALEQAGYKVVLLKSQADEAVSKRARVDAAKAAKADIAVSIHTDSGSGSFEDWAEVWPQFVGGYRQSATTDARVAFSNEEIANLSDSYSNLITEERDKAERGGSGKTAKVVGQSVSFAKSRGLPSYGDLSLVQLWSDDIPWIYNEVGAPTGGLTDTQKFQYASGLVNGIKRAVPVSGLAEPAADCPDGGGGAATGGGDSIKTALLYSWPDYRKGDVTMKPEYAAAVKTARDNKLYVGGIKYPGVDCGGFVTRVMLDSGYEPAYNKSGRGGFTGIQLAWVRENWEKVGRGNTLTTADLRPGDVAFKVTSSGANDGHTFMFVGEQPGFGEIIASASLDNRAPMAGREKALEGNIEWYRKKSGAPTPAP